MSDSQSLVSTISGCFGNDTYSDLVVKCHYRSWNVHRVIVCSQSKVLHAACTAGFKETYTGVIDLDDDDPDAVETMLRYFYSGKYNEPVNQSGETSFQLRVQIRTFVLADKYDVPLLVKLAEQKFRSALFGGITPGDYLSVIPEVYTILTSSNALRLIVVDYARLKFRGMMQSSADVEVLQATLQEVPEFAFDALRMFVNFPLRGHCCRCGPNQKVQEVSARCLQCGTKGAKVTY